MKSIVAGAALALVVSITPASAAVYFWPNGTTPPCSPAAPSDKGTVVSSTYCTAPGSGFVGKGDVQLAFGWNNSQIQKNASSLSFAFEGKSVYTQDCWKVAGGPRNTRTLEHTFKRNVTSVAGAESGSRSNKNEGITGFWLLGYSDGGGVSAAPTDLCPATGQGQEQADGPWHNLNPDTGETSSPVLDTEKSSSALCVYSAASSYCFGQ